MQTINGIEIDDFTLAYIKVALWSSTDNADDSGGEPLDDNYTPDDIHPDTLRAMADDCRQFRDLEWTWNMPKAPEGMTGRKAKVSDILAAIPDHLRRGHWSADARNGHDFWLTRNHHGAGFWDRGYGKLGEILTDAAHSFGTYDLYIGDDGEIHGM
jgi:hypothetical protein